MDWTDVHFRQLCRLVSKQTWLYTEMVVDQTLLHNSDTDRHVKHPLHAFLLYAQHSFNPFIASIALR